MKRLASATLAAFLLVIQACFGFPAANAAQPAAEAAGRLRLDVSEMAPRLIESASSTLSVRGTVTNVGDRRLTDVMVRLQLGERQANARQLGAALLEVPKTDAAVGEYAKVADVIEPGQTVPLQITVRLGDGPAALKVARPGVYPLLVNVNGTPEFGRQERLAALNMLLPVLGAPGQGAPPRPEKATEISVLWPLTDTRPHVAAAPFIGGLVLTDDQLATDLATGGRLDALLNAARNVRTDDSLSDALCFGIDPDLVRTVERMTNGYQVRAGAGLVPGRGVDAAVRWMSTLRQVVAGSCVVQLPSADADLAALGRIGGQDPALTKLAVDGAGTIESLLNVKPLPGVLWPGSELDESTLTRLGENGVTTLITDSNQLNSPQPMTAPVTIEGTDLRGVSLDPLLTQSMTPPRASSATPGAITPADDPDVAAQNALAALAFQTGPQSETGGAPILFAPPRRLSAPVDELTTLLRTISTFSGLGMVSPKPLLEQLAQPVKGTAPLSTSGLDTPVELPQSLIGSLGGTEQRADDFQAALTGDPTTQTEPVDLVQPVRTSVLRAASSAWRSNVEGAHIAAADADNELNSLRAQVTVETPKQQISLASDSSPLPVTLKNSLPVQVTVRVILANFAGLRPNEPRDRLVPARGAVQELIQAEALRTGRFSVDVSVSTPGGTSLGAPARMELTSTEFGTITLIVTVVAGAALLLLSGRRIYRRIRGKDQRAEA